MDDTRMLHIFKNLSFNQWKMFSVMLLQLVFAHLLESVLFGMNRDKKDTSIGTLSYFVLDLEIFKGDTGFDF